jgi:Yip1 domain
MSTTPLLPATSEQQKMSALDRVVNIFVAPSKVFSDLNRDFSWWPAWLLICVFSLIFVFAMQKKVGFEQITTNEIAASPNAQERMEKLTPEQRNQQIQVSVAITKGFTYGLPITILIFASIIAGVFLATFNFGLGAEMKFGLVLAVVLWAWVPGILKSLLGAISLFAGSDPEGFSVSNPVATNPGWLVNRAEHPALYSLASYVDIFAIWYIILMGIGFAAVSKVSRSTATSVVAGWYLLVMIGSAAWAAMFA